MGRFSHNCKAADLVVEQRQCWFGLVFLMIVVDLFGLVFHIILVDWFGLVSHIVRVDLFGLVFHIKVWAVLVWYFIS